MTRSENTNNRDLDRVAQELTGRLHTLGIDVPDTESPELLETLMAAVEKFEEAFRSHGGDLMVDEPPRGSEGKAQPDNPMFLLPTHSADESVSRYIVRLQAATEAIRSRGPTL